MAAEWVTVSVTENDGQPLAGATAEISFGTDVTPGVWMPAEVTVVGATLTARVLADPASHRGRATWVRVHVGAQVIERTVSGNPVVSFAGDSPDEVDATAVIRALCGWHIASVLTEERRIDSHGGHVLTLPTTHLLEVVAAVPTSPDAWPIDVAAVQVSQSGIIRAPGGWPMGLGAVTLTFTHGFAQVPGDLAAACRSMAKHIGADPAAAPVAAFTKTQGSKSLSKTFSVGTAAALLGSLSMVERLVLARYSCQGATP